MATITSFDPEVLTIDSLTSGERTGSGAFDELMRTVESHIQNQLDLGNLTKQQFAALYSGAIASTLQESRAYVLEYQTVNQNIRLLDKQIAAAEKNVELVQKQIDKLTADIAFVNEQATSETKRQLLLDQELKNSIKQELILDKQALNLDKDLEVKDAQVLQTEAQASLAGQQEANLQAEQANIVKQGNKLDAETAVLTQKRITEEFQTKDTVQGAQAGGIIGKQMALYENQAEGYIRDAEQKAAKLFMDSFNTRTSIESLNENETTDATVTGAQIKDVLNKVREGVNVTVQA